MVESRVSQHLISRESCLLHFGGNGPHSESGTWCLTASHMAQLSPPPLSVQGPAEPTPSLPPQRGRAAGQGPSGALKARELSWQGCAKPAVSLPAQPACSSERPKQAPSKDRQADGLGSHPAGVRLVPSSSPLPSPVAHQRRVTPDGKQGISCHALLAARPSRGTIHLWYFRKDTQNLCEEGSVESR